MPSPKPEIARTDDFALIPSSTVRSLCGGVSGMTLWRWLNGLEPEAWLTDVIARIGAHPINRLAELLPWNWQSPATQSVAA